MAIRITGRKSSRSIGTGFSNIPGEVLIGGMANVNGCGELIVLICVTDGSFCELANAMMKADRHAAATAFRTALEMSIGPRPRLACPPREAK